MLLLITKNCYLIFYYTHNPYVNLFFIPCDKFFTNLLNMYQIIFCASSKLVKMYNLRTTACNADYVFYI